MKVPKFLGSSNLDIYMDWEMKPELIFSCHDLEDDKKMTLATLEFGNYAMVWCVTRPAPSRNISSSI